jgi:hypothetical protein
MSYQAPLDYITVAERIVEFRGKYPEGSLQPADLTKPYTIETINGNPTFVVVAAAYRTPEDTRPGIGMAYEPIPGSTPYTRGSELQNAETAAWGRAIVAALAADTKAGIASKDEIQIAEQRQGMEQQVQPKAAADDGFLADWHAAVDGAVGDYDALGRLHVEAKAKNAPAEILARIKTEGLKVKK